MMGNEKTITRTRTKYTDDALNSSAELLERMVSALRRTASGECSMMEACKQKHLNYKRVRSVLQTKAFAECDLQKKPMTLEGWLGTDVLKPSGAEQLYIDIFGIRELELVELPPDYEETVLDVLGTLTENEAKVITLRYGLNGQFPMYLYEVAEEIGITPERAHQIEEKARHKLCHYSVKRHLMIGSIAWQAEQKLKEVVKEEYQNEIMDWVDIEMRSAQEHAKFLGLVDRGDDPTTINLGDMGLSVRTYNCLRRAGKETLADILAMEDEDLLNVHNLGRCGVEEVKKKRDDAINRIKALARP